VVKFIVSILANHGGSKNLGALLKFLPHYSALTNLEKTAFSSFVSKSGAADRVALAQVLIEKHGSALDNVERLGASRPIFTNTS
jgi:hypothetical protein